MRLNRLFVLTSTSISGTRKPQLNHSNHHQNHQKQQPQNPSPLSRDPVKPQDLLAYRLSGLSRDKLREEASDPEHDLRRFLGNAAVNRATVNWVHRDLIRRVDEIEDRQREIMAGMEVLHVETV